MTLDDPLVPYDESGHTALRRFFFRDASLTETPVETIGWWEKRRLPFNLAVGVAGLTTVTAINLLGLIGPGAHVMGFPWIPAVIYAVLANVMYTGGWISELLMRPLFGRRTPVVGSTIFRYGFAFSVGLTALPITMGVVDLAIRVLKWVL